MFNFCDKNKANILHNPSFQFAQKHALCGYKHNFIYSFIPKNGCTTLRSSLAVTNGFVDKNTLTNQNINWVHNNTYSFSASIKDLINCEYKFTVLRCPFDRLVSLFLDKFVDKTPVAWLFYRQSDNIYDLNQLTFRQFINHLHSHPHILHGDIHWRKQSDFLVYRDYDDYFRFEDFSTIETVLNSKFPFELIDTRQITKHGRDTSKTVSDKDYSNTSSNELLNLKLQGQTPTKESMLDSEIMEKIKNIYHSDFDLRNNR